MNIEDYITKKIWPLRHGFLGLLICFVFINIISNIVIKNDIAFKIFKNLDHEKKVLIYLAYVFIQLLLSVILWKLLFAIKKFSDNEIGILLAIDTTKNTEDEIKSIYNQLETLRTNNYGFSDKMRNVILPKVLNPKSDKQAYRLVKKFNAKVIVWGETDYGKINSEDNFILKAIKFSYHINLPDNVVKSINHIISISIGEKVWVVREKESLIDRDYVVKNIKEISFWILGLVMFFENDYTMAFDFFEESLKKISEVANSQNSARHIGDLIKNLIDNKIYNEILKNKLYPNTNQSILKKSIQATEKNVQLCDRFGLIYNSTLLRSHLAISKDKDVKKALNFAHQANAMDGKESGNLFCLAYLYFYDENLTNGYKFLKLALKRPATSRMLQQSPEIIRWYDEALREDPSKKFLCFPIGMLSYYLIKDKSSSKDSFDIFLNYYKYDNSRIIKILIKKTNQLLKRMDRK